jgi:outer membrane protein assembly factor BamB
VFSSPTVAGDLVFVGSCNGFFRALNKNTGALVWSYETKQDGNPVEFHGDAYLTSDLIIASSDHRQQGGKGFIYAFERSTGKLRWRYAAGNGAMTDVIGNGSNVYFVTLNDELVCLDLATGRENWKHSSGVKNDDFLTNSDSALSSGRVFFGGMDGNIYAFDERSGKEVWRASLGMRPSTSIAVLDNYLYVGTIAGRLYRLSKQTGEVVADYPLGAMPHGKLKIADNLILVSLGDQVVLCLDAELKNLKWRKEATQEWTTARPYVVSDSALIADRTKLYGFRLTDGAEVLTHDFPGVVRGIGNDDFMLYVGTLKGIVYAVRSPFKSTAPR